MFILLLINPFYTILLSRAGGIGITSIFAILLFLESLVIRKSFINKNLGLGAICIGLYLAYSINNFDEESFFFYLVTIIQIPIGIAIANHLIRDSTTKPQNSSVVKVWIMFQVIGLGLYFYDTASGVSYFAFRTYVDNLGIAVNRYMDWLVVPIFLIFYANLNDKDRRGYLNFGLTICILGIIFALTRTVIVGTLVTLLTLVSLFKMRFVYLRNFFIIALIIFFVLSISGDSNLLIDRIINLFGTSEYDTSSSSRLNQFVGFYDFEILGKGFMSSVNGDPIIYLASFFISLIFGMGVVGIVIVISILALHLRYYILIRTKLTGELKTRATLYFATLNYLCVVLNLFPYTNYMPILALYVAMHYCLINIYKFQPRSKI